MCRPKENKILKNHVTSWHEGSYQIRCRIENRDTGIVKCTKSQADWRGGKTVRSSESATYTNCRLLSSPIAGEISHPRFRLDRFLFVHRKQYHQKILIIFSKHKKNDPSFSRNKMCNIFEHRLHHIKKNQTLFLSGTLRHKMFQEQSLSGQNMQQCRKK